jgi:hypothetical protein
VQLRLQREHLCAQRVLAGPAARGREGHHGARAAPRGELERDETAERARDDVGGFEARVVHGTFGRVGHQLSGGRAFERRPARVAGEGRGEDVVPALERGQHELPGAPRLHEAVQAEERRAGAAAM